MTEPPAPPAEDDAATSGETPEPAAAEEAAASPAPTPPAASAKDTNRNYGIFTELTIAVGSAAERKATVEKLAELAPEDGKLVVLVRIGKAIAPEPKAALKSLGQVRVLDGDYQVVADSARNMYEGVKTKQETTVSFG